MCPTLVSCGDNRRTASHLQLANVAKIDALGDGSEMDVRKPNVGRVEAVGSVVKRDPFVTRLGKRNVDALSVSALAFAFLPHNTTSMPVIKASLDTTTTYREQRGAVLCRHDNLDRRIDSRLDADVRRHRDLIQTDGAREGVVARANNAKLWHNLVGHL